VPALQFEPLPLSLGHKMEILVVLTDVLGHEAAVRQHLEFAGARPLQRSADDCGGKALRWNSGCVQVRSMDIRPFRIR
jgi:hypothetical protein